MNFRKRRRILHIYEANIEGFYQLFEYEKIFTNSRRVGENRNLRKIIIVGNTVTQFVAFI